MLLAKPYSVATRMRNQAETLAGAGYKVDVLFWDRWRREPKEATINGVNVKGLRLLGGSDLFVSSIGPKSSKLSYAISAIILQFYSFIWCLRNSRGAAIIHTNFPTLPTGVALRLVRPKSIKLVYDCQELTPGLYTEWYGPTIGRVAASIEKILLRFVNVAITVSEPILSYLSHVNKHLSTSNSSLVLLYNTPRISELPSDDKTSCRRRLGLSGFVVSFVGSIRGAYALDQLIEAARKFQDSSIQVRFVIAGGGELRTKLEQKLILYQLGDCVTLMPQISHQLALEYIKSGDVVFAVFGDPSENSRLAMPWKVLEAMACGTPVMVRENTQAWQFVKSNGVGFSVASESPPEIYDKLIWAMNHPAELADMSSKARDAYNSTYSWEAASRQFVDVYSTL